MTKIDKSNEKLFLFLGIIVTVFVVGCYPNTTPIEVMRNTPVATLIVIDNVSTEEIIQFVDYVLPPQAKPHLKDFLDYEYFLSLSGEPVIPLICVSWEYNNFYRDRDFELWYKDLEERVHLTVNGVSLSHWIRHEDILELIEIKDGQEIFYSEPSLDCWEYKPVLGEHEAVFSLRRTNDQIITYSWKFTVIE